MKITRHAAHACIAGLLLAASGLVHASGGHANGHGHGEEETETAIGKPGIAAKSQRTITVVMSDDMRFTPSHIRVRQGETVRFLIKNKGQVPHEWALGTQKDLLEHLEAMKKAPEMAHDEPGKVTLAPGKQSEIVWQFTQPGAVDFACLLPGHFEAGMKGSVTVGKK